MTGIPDQRIIYYNKQGRPHRIGAPAKTVYRDGVIEEEIWSIDGEYHRVDGPALTNVDHGTHEWYWQGSPHRYYGPQSVSFGNRHYWALHGVQKSLTRRETELPKYWAAAVWLHFHNLGNGYGMTATGLDGKTTRTRLMRKLLNVYSYHLTLEQIQQVWESLDESYEMDTDMGLNTITFTYKNICSRLFDQRIEVT